MKLIIVFSVFCSIAVSTVHSERVMEKFNFVICNDKDSKEIYEECARELNIKDLEKLVKSIQLDEFLVNPNDDVMCMFTCTLKKQHNYSTTTLYEGFLKAVEIAYENKFKTTKFTRSDVESKINNCYVQEQEECNFVRCVEPTKLPFIDIFPHDLSVISKIALGEAAKALKMAISSSISF